MAQALQLSLLPNMGRNTLLGTTLMTLEVVCTKEKEASQWF